MVSALNGDADSSIDVQYRKAAFKAQSHIWGVQSRAVLHSFIYNVARDDPEKLDVAMIRGAVKLRRLRPDATRRIAGIGISDDEGTCPDPIERERSADRRAASSRRCRSYRTGTGRRRSARRGREHAR